MARRGLRRRLLLTGEDEVSSRSHEPVAGCRAVGRLRDFLLGPPPPPAPPPRSGPFRFEWEATAEAKRLNGEFWAHLDSYRGFMEVVEEDGGWSVVERRGRKKPGSYGYRTDGGGAGGPY